jgi:hypothetical protein
VKWIEQKLMKFVTFYQSILSGIIDFTVKQVQFQLFHWIFFIEQMWFLNKPQKLEQNWKVENYISQLLSVPESLWSALDDRKAFSLTDKDWTRLEMPNDLAYYCKA